MTKTDDAPSGFSVTEPRQPGDVPVQRKLNRRERLTMKARKRAYDSRMSGALSRQGSPWLLKADPSVVYAAAVDAAHAEAKLAAKLKRAKQLAKRRSR